jgi:hypothetical protein
LEVITDVIHHQGSQFDDSPIISPSSIDCSGPLVALIPQESVDLQLLLDDLPIDSSFSIDLEASIDRSPDWDRVENPVHHQWRGIEPDSVHRSRVDDTAVLQHNRQPEISRHEKIISNKLNFYNKRSRLIPDT